MATASETAPGRPLLTVKDVLWLVYLYPLRLAARLLPAGFFRLLSLLVDPCCQILTRGQKRLVRAHLRRAMRGQKEERLNHLTNAFMSNAVRRALDDLVLDKLSARGLVCSEMRGLEHLTQALAGGKGVMLLGGHFYANRLGKRYLERIGHPMLSVRNRRPPDMQMGRFGERFLHQRYIEYLHGVIRDEVFIQDRDCTLKILKRLRTGGIVHIYLDAGVTRLRTGGGANAPLWLPFLGTLRPFPTGFLRVMRSSDCVVLPMLCLGDSSNLRISFGAPANLDCGGPPDEFAADNLPALTAALESDILDHPSQWELWGISELSTDLGDNEN